MAITRAAQALLVETLAARRVVVITGPRQAGKTTLVGQLLAELDRGTLRSLDDPGLLDAALADPTGFAESGATPLAIDEVQRAGEPLVRAVKAQVDRSDEPGQFVLTGSSDFLTVPTISESLAGRAGLVQIWPFTQGELAGRSDRFIDAVFGDAGALGRYVPSGLSKTDLLERLAAGGYPEVQRLPAGRQRANWYRDYVRTTIVRDIVELSGVRNADELAHLLRLLAARTGCELVMQNVIDDSTIARQTVYAYRAWLENVHLVTTIPAWSRNLTRRVTRRPKVYITDSGLAAWLLGKNAEALSTPGDPAVGQLVETFAATELLRQAAWAQTRVTISHFRDRDGFEVDLILESDDGRIVALEIKAGETPRRDWFRWIERMRDATGDAFVAGIALHTGRDALPFGDRLHAIPISALWEL